MLHIALTCTLVLPCLAQDRDHDLVVSAGLKSAVGGEGSLDSVAITLPEKMRYPSLVLAQADADTASDEQGDETTETKSPWSGNYQLGFIFKDGNTDSLELTIGAEALRQSERRELSLRFRYDYEESGRELEDNVVFVDVENRMFWAPKPFWFARGVFRYDEVDKLDYRFATSVGLGYRFMNTEDTRLLVEAGVGPLIQSYAGEDTETEAIALFYGLWKTKVFDQSVFSQEFSVVPFLTDIRKIVVTSLTSLTTPLSESLSLRISLLDEYESEPTADGVDENDVTFRTTLMYVF
jgi:putative salt-induced outer membrane protein YdiY